jgi:hypothetical protein
VSVDVKANGMLFEMFITLIKKVLASVAGSYRREKEGE